MLLTQEEIAGLDKYITGVANAQNVERDKIISLFNYYIKELSELPSIKGRTRRYLFGRVRSQIDNYFSNKRSDGERYVYVPFGQLGRTRDWASGLFNHVKEEFERMNIEGLVNDDRIMWMEKDGKRVPISSYEACEFKTVYIDIDKILKFDEPGEGRKEIQEMVITKGKEWEKGEPVIPKDYRFVRFNRINFNYSRPLEHEWTLNMVGMAFPTENPDDVRLFDIPVNGRQADINSSQYIFKNAEPFQAYQGNFVLEDEKNKKGRKTTPWRYYFRATTIDTKPYNLELKDGMAAAIEDLFQYLHDNFEEDVKKTIIGTGEYAYPDQLPDFLYGYSEMELYHAGEEGFSGQVKRDKTGHVITNNGWDRTHWNKFGVMAVTMEGLAVSKEKGSNPRYILTDSIGKPPTMYIFKPVNCFKTPRPPCKCIAMFSTRRNPMKWDSSIGKKVAVPGGVLELQLNTISEIPDPDKTSVSNITAPDLDDI